MPFEPGTYALGPDDATIVVSTGRAGAAARAAHDLTIHVTSWEATLEVADAPGQSTIELTADARSLRVREGAGGIQALGDKDKTSIQKTIDEDVLKGEPIEFRSTDVQPSADHGRLSVRGNLELVGKGMPIAFELTVGQDGQLIGSTTLRQTDWGIKPYSALFGTLKVADEVEVVIEASLPAASRGSSRST